MATDEPLPLSGTTVLITRPAHQSGHLTRLIEQAGGQTVSFPTLAIADTPEQDALRKALDPQQHYDIAIFISTNAVDFGVPAMRRYGMAASPGMRLACVGDATARALAAAGLHADAVPEDNASSEALLAHELFNDVSGKDIVIFRGNGGREWLADSLRARGARVRYAECYRRSRPNTDPARLIRQWQELPIDIVTVASAQTLQNLWDMIGEAGQALLQRTPLVVFSQRAANMAQRLGVTSEVMISEQSSDEGLVAAVKKWRTSQNPI